MLVNTDAAFCCRLVNIDSVTPTPAWTDMMWNEVLGSSETSEAPDQLVLPIKFVIEFGEKFIRMIQRSLDDEILNAMDDGDYETNLQLLRSMDLSIQSLMKLKKIQDEHNRGRNAKFPLLVYINEAAI